ncbi:UNVERIFIED_CONTAM: hypothetical protein FKN15_068888 [Acipenser sinensis]
MAAYNNMGSWFSIDIRMDSDIFLSGFFKGVSMPVSTVSVSSSVAFGTYRNCLQCIQQCRYGSGDARPAHLDFFLSGLAAGSAQVVVMSPADVVKVRLQTQTQPEHAVQGSTANMKVKYQGPLHCMATILSGFFKGVSMPVSTVSVSSSVAFGTYRNCLQCIQQCRYGSGDARPAHLDFFLSGLAAGSAQWLFTLMEVTLVN